MRNENSDSIYIKACVTDDDIMSTFPVMKQLRSIEEETYASTIRMLFNEEYHLVGCFDANNICLGVIGYNIGHSLHTGKMIYVADLVVDEKHRSCHYGKKLMDWIKSESIRLNCRAIVLDSGVQRPSAHRFYFKNNFEITSFNFKLFNTKVMDEKNLR